jgi:hypothetical protein
LDHRRIPKPAYEAVAAACAETIVVADPPPLSITPRSTLQFQVLVVHDGRAPIDHIRVDAVLTVSGREQTWSWGGSIEADSVTLIGTIQHQLGDAIGEVLLDLRVTRTAPPAGGRATTTNHYRGRIGAG